MPETRSTTTPARVTQSLQYTFMAPGVVFKGELRSPSMTWSTKLGIQLLLRESEPDPPGSPAEWLRSIRTVICLYCGDCIVKSGTYRATGASNEIFPASTSCITATAVTTLPTDAIPYFVVGDGFLPAVLTRPKVWLHTVLPLDTNATDADVAPVCFNVDRMALRPALIVWVNDCFDFAA